MTVQGNEPIRVGIAGLGRSGWGIHARLLEPLKDKYRIVATCDIDAARGQEMVARFGGRAYQDYAGLLGDPEVELIVVALPSYLHPSHSIMALQAGKHIVCEKPMAARVSDADAMIAAAKKAGKVLTIFQNRRYHADFLKVREVIASGKLGRIVMIPAQLRWRLAQQHRPPRPRSGLAPLWRSRPPCLLRLAANRHLRRCR